MGSCSYLTERKKEEHYTLVHNTTITVVHNIHSSAQHIHDTETFRLPERQVGFNHDFSISQYFNTSVLGVVVRGSRKHYVNSTTEKNLSALRPRNCRSLGCTAQGLAAHSCCKSFYFIHA